MHARSRCRCTASVVGDKGGLSGKVKMGQKDVSIKKTSSSLYIYSLFLTRIHIYTHSSFPVLPTRWSLIEKGRGGNEREVQGGNKRLMMSVSRRKEPGDLYVYTRVGDEAVSDDDQPSLEI